MSSAIYLEYDDENGSGGMKEGGRDGVDDGQF